MALTFNGNARPPPTMGSVLARLKFPARATTTRTTDTFLLDLAGWNTRWSERTVAVDEADRTLGANTTTAITLVPPMGRSGGLQTSWCLSLSLESLCCWPSRSFQTLAVAAPLPLPRITAEAVEDLRVVGPAVDLAWGLRTAPVQDSRRPARVVHPRPLLGGPPRMHPLRVDTARLLGRHMAQRLDSGLGWAREESWDTSLVATAPDIDAAMECEEEEEEAILQVAHLHSPMVEAVVVVGDRRPAPLSQEREEGDTFLLVEVGWWMVW